MAIYEIPQDSKIWIENELNKKYSSDKAEEKYREIIELYEKFLNDALTIGGKDNPMSKNFYGALSAFAYYECMNRNMSSEEITNMYFQIDIVFRMPQFQGQTQGAQHTGLEIAGGNKLTAGPADTGHKQISTQFGGFQGFHGQSCE